MKKTIFAGLTILDPGEGLSTDDGAFTGRDREAIDRLLRIAFALGASDGFDQLFAPRDPRSLDEIITEPAARQRGRRR